MRAEQEERASQWLGQFVDDLSEATSGITELVGEALEELGLQRVIYAFQHSESESRAPWSFDTMPQWWRDVVHVRSRPDPFFEFCCQSYDVTFTGAELTRDYGFLPFEDVEFIGRAADTGFTAGAAVPMLVGDGPWVGGWNVGGDFSERDWRGFWGSYGPAVRLALAYAHARLVSPSLPARLSPRERECLEGLAEGEQLKQVSERLGIAYSTVEFHLRNARRKLRARTKEQAVARALVAGLIAPRLRGFWLDQS